MAAFWHKPHASAERHREVVLDLLGDIRGATDALEMLLQDARDSQSAA